LRPKGGTRRDWAKSMNDSSSGHRTSLLLPSLLLLLAQTARATWSIVVCDVTIGEIIVASATC